MNELKNKKRIFVKKTPGFSLKSLVMLLVVIWVVGFIGMKALNKIEHIYQSHVGACGIADGAGMKMAPKDNLCKTGTASAVTKVGKSEWSWSCTGINDTTAQCSAHYATHGKWEPVQVGIGPGCGCHATEWMFGGKRDKACMQLGAMYACTKDHKDNSLYIKNHKLTANCYYVDGASQQQWALECR